MTDRLVDFATMFMVTNGLFFTALGAAETSNDKLKVGLSIGGVIVSGLWLICTVDVEPNPMTPSDKVLVWMPVVFGAGWLISGYIHACNWAKRRYLQPWVSVAGS